MNTAPRKKCAFLSMDSLDEFECYDISVFPHLQSRHWQVEEVSWRIKEHNWDQYDLVVIRSPWDYQQDEEQFLDVLASIEASSAILANPLSVVHWNINKKYLRELELKGVEIVPTIWQSSFDTVNFLSFFSQLQSDELIIKPCVSANADHTYRINAENLSALSETLVPIFKNRECMVQPFMNSVIDEGEFSLFYFNNQYSHAILKTPKENDFRVQEEHGSRLKKIEPEPLLKEQSEKTLAAIDSNLLYARIDFVRSDSGFALMEAELIEPSLYFNMDDTAPERFAVEIDKEYG